MGAPGLFPLYSAGQGDAKGACLRWDAIMSPPPWAGVLFPLLESLALRVNECHPAWELCSPVPEQPGAED